MAHGSVVVDKHGNVVGTSASNDPNEAVKEVRDRETKRVEDAKRGTGSSSTTATGGKPGKH